MIDLGEGGVENEIKRLLYRWKSGWPRLWKVLMVKEILEEKGESPDDSVSVGKWWTL